MAASKLPVRHRITMWGAPGTGKTTFLAALQTALIRQGTSGLVGQDEPSTNELIKMMALLTHDHVFPPVTAGVCHHRLALTGPSQSATRQRQRFRKRPPRRLQGQHDDNVLSLDIIDPAGGCADPDASGRQERNIFLDFLSGSEAIIFFYDPIREFEVGDTFDHTFGILIEMAHRIPGPPGGRLPHYVAVCVTKFDEIRVLATADRLGLLTYMEDPYKFPRVPDGDTREFLDALCKISASQTALTVRHLLERTFRPDRIGYFTTSAAGFYLDRQHGTFNPDDYQNVIRDGAGPARIRGAIHPINVAEPVLWLCEKLAEKSAGLSVPTRPDDRTNR